MTRLPWLLFGLLFLPACHGGSNPAPPGPEADKSRQEAALAAALRWIPTQSDFRGLPVVLMAGDANGDFRPAWIDSLVTAKVIDHACTQIAVADCNDYGKAAYAGFSQPRLGTDDRSVDVSMTVVVMDPSTCGKPTAETTEVTGRLHMPWIGSTVRNYRWTVEKSLQARC